MVLVTVLGYSGGIIAFLTAVVVIGRGIFKQISATEDNTDAVKELTAEVTSLKNGFNGHEVRITVLEDRNKRSRNESH